MRREEEDGARRDPDEAHAESDGGDRAISI